MCRKGQFVPAVPRAQPQARGWRRARVSWAVLDLGSSLAKCHRLNEAAALGMLCDIFPCTTPVLSVFTVHFFISVFLEYVDAYSSFKAGISPVSDGACTDRQGECRRFWSLRWCWAVNSSSSRSCCGGVSSGTCCPSCTDSQVAALQGEPGGSKCGGDAGLDPKDPHLSCERGLARGACVHLPADLALRREIPSGELA